MDPLLRSELIARLERDAAVIATRFGLRYRVIEAESARVKRRYGVCFRDGTIRIRLAHVVTGGDTDVTETVSDDDLLRLEREAFMTLIKHPATLARLEHMLETGKPLRN